MIFIAKDHTGTIIGIVSANSIESVNAYFQGKDDLPHSITKFEEGVENQELGYVTPILKTQKITHYNSPSSGRMVI